MSSKSAPKKTTPKDLLTSQLVDTVGKVNWSDKEDMLYYPEYLHYLCYYSESPKCTYDLRTEAERLVDAFEKQWETFDLSFLPQALKSYGILSVISHRKANPEIVQHVRDTYFNQWLSGKRKKVPLSRIMMDLITERENGIITQQKLSYLDSELRHWISELQCDGRLMDPNSNRTEDIRRATILLEERLRKHGIDATAVYATLISRYVPTDFSQDTPETLSASLRLFMAIPPDYSLKASQQSKASEASAADLTPQLSDLCQAIIMHPATNPYLREIMRFNALSLSTQFPFILAV